MNPLFHSSSALTENVKTPSMTRQTLLVVRPPVFVFVFHLCGYYIVVKKAVDVNLSRCAAITAIWTAIQTSQSNSFRRLTIKNPSLPRRFSAPMHFSPLSLFVHINTRDRPPSGGWLFGFFTGVPSPKNILSPWPPPYYFNSMFLITCIICPRLLFCSLKHIMILSQLYKPLPTPPPLYIFI